MAGLADAPTIPKIGEQIDTAKASSKEIGAVNTSPGFKNNWKALLESWNKYLEAAHKIICDMDKYREKMNKYLDDSKARKLGIFTIISGLIALLAGSGLVTAHWAAISALFNKIFQ